MKKIIILIVSFLLVVGVCFGFFFFNYSKSEKNQDNKKIEYNNVDEKNEIIIEDSDKDNIIEEETNDNVIEDNTDENKENNSVNNKKEENKPITQTPQNNSNNSNDSKKEEKKEENKPIEKTEEVKEEPKKEPTSNAWDELGISEYDYYNKPMWNWARIDFSIKDYKTYEKTREACVSKGEEYFNEGYGYSCTSINSYSGDYLGEMLKTF